MAFAFAFSSAEMATISSAMADLDVPLTPVATRGQSTLLQRTQSMSALRTGQPVPGAASEEGPNEPVRANSKRRRSDITPGRFEVGVSSRRPTPGPYPLNAGALGSRRFQSPDVAQGRQRSQPRGRSRRRKFSRARSAKRIVAEGLARQQNVSHPPLHVPRDGSSPPQADALEVVPSTSISPSNDSYDDAYGREATHVDTHDDYAHNEDAPKYNDHHDHGKGRNADAARVSMHQSQSGAVGSNSHTKVGKFRIRKTLVPPGFRVIKATPQSAFPSQPGDGFSDDELMPIFTSTLTGKRRREASRPSAAMEKLTLEVNSSDEDGFSKITSGWPRSKKSARSRRSFVLSGFRDPWPNAENFGEELSPRPSSPGIAQLIPRVREQTPAIVPKPLPQRTAPRQRERSAFENFRRRLDPDNQNRHLRASKQGRKDWLSADAQSEFDDSGMETGEGLTFFSLSPSRESSVITGQPELPSPASGPICDAHARFDPE